jgi:MFS family permease
MQQIAMIWWVYEITRSPLMLGIMGFVSQIPILFLAPVAGVWADRFSKKHLLIYTQIGFMFCAFIFASLAFFNVTSIPILVCLGLTFGFINAVDTPVRQAFFIELIEDPLEVGNAVALNSVAFHGTRLVGPAIAGFIIYFLGPAACFGLNALGYLAVLLALFFIQPQQHDVHTETHNGFLHSLAEGLRYATSHSAIRSLLLLVALTSLFGMSYVILLAAYVKEIYLGGASLLGLLMSTAGIGAFGSAIYIASREKVLSLPLIMYGATFLLGFSLMGISKTHGAFSGAPFLFLVGVSMMIILGGSNVIIQTIVAPNYRGRVVSVYAMAFGGTVPIGNLLVGWISSNVGLCQTFFICGVACVIAGVIFGLTLNSIGKSLFQSYNPSKTL